MHSLNIWKVLRSRGVKEEFELPENPRQKRGQGCDFAQISAVWQPCALFRRTRCNARQVKDLGLPCRYPALGPRHLVARTVRTAGTARKANQSNELGVSGESSSVLSRSGSLKGCGSDFGAGLHQHHRCSVRRRVGGALVELILASGSSARRQASGDWLPGWLGSGHNRQSQVDSGRRCTTSIAYRH